MKMPINGIKKQFEGAGGAVITPQEHQKIKLCQSLRLDLTKIYKIERKKCKVPTKRAKVLI